MNGESAAMTLTIHAFVEAAVTPPATLWFAIVSDEEAAGDARFLPGSRDQGSRRRRRVIVETPCEGGRHSVAVAGDVTGERNDRRSATGGGDVKTVRDVGISSVEFGLGMTTAHAVDEYTTVDALVGNAELCTALPKGIPDNA